MPKSKTSVSRVRVAALAGLPMTAFLQAMPTQAATVTDWKGGGTTSPYAIKDSTNWTAGLPATNVDGIIDNSLTTVPATLYFGDTTGSLGVSQTLGALTINSPTLTALNANAQASGPATSTTYSVAFAGDGTAGDPLISLGSAVTQAVSISDTTNSILNLQLGLASSGINIANSSASLTINSKVIDKGGVTASLLKTGDGLLTLTNTGNTFGGTGATVQISGGTLGVDASTELGSSSNTVTLDGGTLLLDPSAALTLARSISVTANGGGIDTSTNTVTVSSALSGSGAITKTGAAELDLNNASGTYNGTITVDQGNLRIINAGSTAAGTTVALVGTNSTLNLRADTNTTYNANVQVQTNPGQLFVANQTAGNSNHVITVGTVLLGATTLDIGATAGTGYTVDSGLVTLTGNGTLSPNTTSLTVPGVTESGGSYSLSKAGASTLILNGPGTWSGGTNIQAGTLQLNSASALPTGTSITMGFNGLPTATTGTLDLNGFSPTIGGLSDVNGSGNIIGNSSTTSDSTLIFAGSTTPSAYAGVIQDSLGSGTHKTALTVSSGNLTLTGPNTYTGNTIVSSGAELNLIAGSIAPTDAISDSGVLNFAGNTAASPTTDSIGPLTIETDGAVNILESSDPSSPTILEPSDLTFADSTGKLDIYNNQMLTNLSQSQVQSLISDGQIYTSDNGTVTYSDAGGGMTQVSYAAVPEPATLGLVSLGLMATGLIRRRRAPR